jgi:hypothetical protein
MCKSEADQANEFLYIEAFIHVLSNVENHSPATPHLVVLIACQ